MCQDVANGSFVILTSAMLTNFNIANASWLTLEQR